MLTLMHWRVSFQGCKGQGSGAQGAGQWSYQHLAALLQVGEGLQSFKVPSTGHCCHMAPQHGSASPALNALQLACPTAAGMWLLGGAVVVMRLTGGTLAHVAGKAGLETGQLWAFLQALSRSQ